MTNQEDLVRAAISFKERDGEELSSHQKIFKFIDTVNEGETPDTELLSFIAKGLEKVDLRASVDEVGSQFKTAFNIPLITGAPRKMDLSEKHLEVFKLKHEEGMTDSGIAEELHFADARDVRAILGNWLKVCAYIRSKYNNSKKSARGNK